MASAPEILRYGSQLLEAVVILRLLWIGLGSRYKFFLIYLGFDLSISLGLATLNNHSTSYAVIWAVVQPLVWFSETAAVFELFRQVTEHYPKIGGFADKILTGCFIAAGLLAIAITFIELPHTNARYWWYYGPVMASKCVAFACALLLLAQALFFLIFPVKMRRNTRVHRWVLLAYFGAWGTAYFFAPLMNEKIADLANTLLLAIACSCSLVWATALTRAGEIDPVVQATTEEETAQVNDEYEAAMRELKRIRERSLFGN
jgi:hypothetical protein